jgi:hypothetical protein
MDPTPEIVAGLSDSVIDISPHTLFDIFEKDELTDEATRKLPYNNSRSEGGDGLKKSHTNHLVPAVATHPDSFITYEYERKKKGRNMKLQVRFDFTEFTVGTNEKRPEAKTISPD